MHLVRCAVVAALSFGCAPLSFGQTITVTNTVSQATASAVTFGPPWNVPPVADQDIGGAFALAYAVSNLNGATSIAESYANIDQGGQDTIGGGASAFVEVNSPSGSGTSVGGTARGQGNYTATGDGGSLLGGIIEVYLVSTGSGGTRTTEGSYGGPNGNLVFLNGQLTGNVMVNGTPVNVNTSVGSSGVMYITDQTVPDPFNFGVQTDARVNLAGAPPGSSAGLEVVFTWALSY